LNSIYGPLSNPIQNQGDPFVPDDLLQLPVLSLAVGQLGLDADSGQDQGHEQEAQSPRHVAQHGRELTMSIVQYLFFFAHTSNYSI
jgi:hypothetical protein